MKNLILGVINYISLPLINIIMLPKITKSIEPSIYGEYTFFNNLFSMILIFSFLDIVPIIIQRYLNRQFSNYREIKKIVVFLNYLSIILFIIITFFVFLIFKSKLLILVALNLACSNLINQIGRFCIVNGKIKENNLLKLSNVIIYMVSLIFLIRLQLFNIYALLLGNLLYSLVVLIYLGSKNLKRILNLRKVDKRLLKEVLKYGIPFIFINLSGGILNFGDRYIIKLLLQNPEYWIGIYSIQYTIYSQIFNLFLQLYYLYIPSKLYIVFEKEGLEKFIEKLKIWIKLYIILGVLIIILIEITYPKINSILLSSNYNLNINFIMYIVTGGFLFGIYRLFGEVLNMLKLTNYLNISIWMSGIINIVLNYFFVPKLGIKGAAITTFISYFILVIIIYLVIEKKVQKRILNYREIGLLLFFIISIILIDEIWVREVLEERKVEIIIKGIIEIGIMGGIYLVIQKRRIISILENLK